MTLDMLFIVPPSAMMPKAPDGEGMVPLGVGYLAAILEKAGYQVAIVDMEAERLRKADLVRLLKAYQPRVVGISSVVTTYKNGLRSAQIVKDISPKTKVVLGGPQATFLVEETLACQAVDVIVRFEGEETLLDLMKNFNGDGPSLFEIKGIAFRDGDKIIETERRELISNLDHLPWPARHLFKMDRYTKPGFLITARGCPSHCIFCGANAFYDSPAYRARSPQDVVDEIEFLKNRYNLDSFFIADGNFSFKLNRAIEICDLLIKRQLKMSWTCEARVNTVTPALINKMAEAGCVEIQYGVETGNHQVMQLIRKGITLELVEDAVVFTLKAGLSVNCSFIIGFPWDTSSSVQQTIDFARHLVSLGKTVSPKGKNGRSRVRTIFSPLIPLPGTTIYNHAEELGLRFLTRDWDQFTFQTPIVETEHLSGMEVRQALFSLQHNS